MKELLKKWFALKPKAVEAQAPYKVETPVTPVADDVTRAMLESIPAPVPAKKPAAKKAKTTKQLIEEHPDYKPEVKTKKPHAPRKPKAE
jgi:hypothetical protein